jgi:hypothetical protein
MTEQQCRSYLITHTATFIRDRISKDEWARTQAELSPELRKLLGEAKPAEWCPVSLLNEVNRQVADKLAQNDDDRAREALYLCGKFIAGEATNTFLKILLKMLTPALFVKKLPDIFKRDFSGARMTTQISEGKMSGSIHEAPNFNHLAVTSAGFVSVALENMGKTVDSYKVSNWSLKEPDRDGAAFELTWKN